MPAFISDGAICNIYLDRCCSLDVWCRHLLLEGILRVITRNEQNRRNGVGEEVQSWKEYYARIKAIVNVTKI